MGPNIVAIGGGDVRGGTAPIDRVLVELTGKTNPNLLFIPTASDDNEEYVEAVTEGYGRLGCLVSALRLLGPDDDPETAVYKIGSADLIYVGGGNTKALMAKWREMGVVEELRKFVDSGRPVGGLSAGALCWFRIGNSDWPQYERIPNVMTAPLECMGFVDLVLCPHARHESFRLGDFKAMMADFPGTGVALDDGCAIQIRGEEYRIIISEPDSMAHLFYSREGHVDVRPMPPHEDFRLLADLKQGIIHANLD